MSRRIFASCVLALVACSSDDEPTIRAPRLTEAVEMTGAVHITWTNEEQGCEAIEVERKSVTLDSAPVADFTVIYSVIGAADNKHDGSATERLRYTYRLRCKKASRYSPYSNELSATPNP